MFRPVLITAPAASIVSQAEAKAHLRVDFSDDDTLIASLIASAGKWLDGYAGTLGRCLVNQTWRQDFNDWSGTLRLPFPDVSSATVTYTDTDGNSQTVAASLYEALEDHRSAYVRFKDAFTRPAVDSDLAAPVSVEMVAGYGASASDVPAPIRHAALMLIGHWYEHREAATAGVTVAPTPLAVAALIDPFRRNCM